MCVVSGRRCLEDYLHRVVFSPDISSFDTDNAGAKADYAVSKLRIVTKLLRFAFLHVGSCVWLLIGVWLLRSELFLCVASLHMNDAETRTM